MKLSENWLRSWVNPNLSASEIGEQLTMAGLELDDLTKVAKDFSGVVVGQVLEVVQHPDADKLRVTKVNVGEHSDEPLQIVCGAPNVAVGVKVPVALIGAELPPIEGENGETAKPFKIKKGKLRGVESHGMLCGGSEIDCDDGVDGLLILPDDAPIGVNVREYLHLDDHILDIAITPNRGDCFSVKGIARELAVINKLPFALPFETVQIAQDIDENQAVGVSTTACPRYLAQVVTGVNATQTSPAFILSALKGAGVTPRNLVVDITNFVLLELGQPLHAFDKDKIVGAISVRIANKGEQFQLLNEQNITLTGDELVICDEAGVIALAGIMGGLRTAVTDTTKNVVLESAFFAPLAIAGRARRFGLHTDASQRFERGVDFDLPSVALNRATALLKEFGNVSVGQITSCETLDNLPKRHSVNLPLEKVGKLLGVHIASDEILDILNRLQIKAELQGETIVATPPSHRYDIEIYQDLIEEIARIYGYNNIGGQLPKFALSMNENVNENKALELKNRLASLGYYEAISFSFVDLKLEKLFDNEQFTAPLALANPISSELAVMRRTLLTSLLPCVQYNLNRQVSRVRLFEVGLAFDGETADNLRQTPMLAMVAVGSRDDDSHWHTDKTGAMDFYDLKADVENLLPERLLSKVVYKRSIRPYLHSGQSASVWLGDVCLGAFGQLHPSICKSLDLPTTWVAEFDFEAVLGLYEQSPITPPSKFPSVRRDFAFLVDKAVAWGDLQAIVLAKGGQHLQKAWLFDEYVGERLPDGKKSLAFACVWQDTAGTMSDETIKQLSDEMIGALSGQLGAELRDK